MPNLKNIATLYLCLILTVFYIISGCTYKHVTPFGREGNNTIEIKHTAFDKALDDPDADAKSKARSGLGWGSPTEDPCSTHARHTSSACR